MYWDFPGGPEVRTLCFQLLGAQVLSLVGELGSRKTRGAAKNKNKNKQQQQKPENKKRMNV